MFVVDLGIGMIIIMIININVAILLPHCLLFFFSYFLISLFFLFVFVIKPENPYFASRLGLEVNPLGVYPLGPRSSSCGPTKGTPPPRTTLRTI